MDITLLLSLATLIIASIILCAIFLRRSSAKSKVYQDGQEPGVRARPIRRAIGVRNAHRRMQATVVQHSDEDADGSANEDNNETDEKIEVPVRKIGAKKQAKLAAKAEKKIQREAAEREREERKKKEQILQEERDKQSEKERAEELRQEEAEKKAREEKEKREYEEYLKLKEAFSIEEEGYEEKDEENQNLLQDFVDYVKRNKVVVLEDLATYFGLKTTGVIDRIKELQIAGTLTGVIDDRGKFIYISQEELEAVTKFIRQRGRVSISELAENSNHLINLSPEVNVVEAR